MRGRYAAAGRVVGLVVVLGATLVGLFALSDATRFRGQQLEEGATHVEFTVETRNYHHHLRDAAASLWFPCIGAVGWSDSSGPHAVDDGRFTAWVRPALGEDSRRRLRGCLEDATVDKVRGHVLSMETTT